jgi:hypothetical protein
VVPGLNYGTLYYARVGALNWQGLPDYLAVGSAQTATPPMAAGTVAGAGLSLVLPTALPIMSVHVDVPGGAFPAGTPVSGIESFINTSLTTLAGARSNEAEIVALESQAVFCISAASTCLQSGGLQPAAPVRITVSYDPAKIPADQDERRLHLFRYDPAAAQWTLVPSQDDPASHTINAFTRHFTLFAPFFVAAGADLSSVQVFPQPWEIGDAASPYWASVLTFSNLPAGARVRIFTVTGELVSDGAASPGGVYAWDGLNRFGRKAASGTYFTAIESGGLKKVRRVVVIR